MTGDIALAGVFWQSSPSGPAAPRAIDPPRPLAGTATHPSAEATSGDAADAVTPPVMTTKPARGGPDSHRLQVIVGLTAIALGLVAFALRWLWQDRPQVTAPLTAIAPLRPVALDDPTTIDDLAPSGLRHHLGAIDSWAQTLDHRWNTLTEADKRIAVQIILRNTRAAIDEIREPSLIA